MKKNILILAITAAFIINSTTQSCMAVATSPVGIAVIKQVLLGGLSKAANIFSNKDAFLKSNLIDQALPSQLKNINAMLEKVAPNIVAMEKDYIAQAAAYTVNVASPILNDAVNSLTSADAAKIVNGNPGEATEILRDKTSRLLINAIQPKVTEKLNEFGIVKTLNTILQGSNLLNGILGGQNSTVSNFNAAGGLSSMASEQIVNGLFNIIQNYEVQNSSQFKKALGL